MVVRAYLVPRIGSGASPATAFRPAYIPAGTRYWCMLYGQEPVYLVAADVTAAQHAAIAANSPVTVIPENLSQQVTNPTLTSVQSALSSWDIPGSWVTVGMTYRAVLRGVAAIFQIAQRLSGKFGDRMLQPGVTLPTTLGQLTQQQRTRLQAVVDSFGFNSAGITNSTTVGQFLRAIASQWAGTIRLGAVDL